jgi:hypothetical protein
MDMQVGGAGGAHTCSSTHVCCRVVESSKLHITQQCCVTLIASRQRACAA